MSEDEYGFEAHYPRNFAATFGTVYPAQCTMLEFLRTRLTSSTMLGTFIVCLIKRSPSGRVKR